MSTTARESASSSGQYAEPKRAMPIGVPRAERKDVPRAMQTSSAVWWSSTIGVHLDQHLCFLELVAKDKTQARKRERGYGIRTM